MAIFIDRKYTLLLSPKLQNFQQKNTNLFNFRCHICGDSQKNKSKARGYIYAKGDSYFFACHNGCPGTNLYNVIQKLDPSLAKEYLLETFGEKYTKKVDASNRIIPKPPKFDIPLVDTQLNLPTISSLDDDHPAKLYLIGRKIPEKFFSELFYAEDFAKFAKEICGKEFDKTSSRVIIPFYDKHKKLIAFQGRAIDASPMRYITIKLAEANDKIFGLHRVNKKKTVYVCEGPIDSLFIPNCIATADSNLSVASRYFDKENLVLIPDFEPRNKNIVKNIKKWIDSGYNVCLFPESVKSKDINQMVKDGISPERILKIIEDNTFSGLSAQLEFIKWKKID